MPWFAGWSGGSVVMLGPTGGYMVGFIAAAAFVGFVTDRFAIARRFVPQCYVMLAGVGIILLCGALQYSVVMGAGLQLTLAKAVAPFIAVDVLKAYLAASTARALLPRGENGRNDAH